MAFFCPVKIRRNKKKNGNFESDLLSGSRQLQNHQQQQPQISYQQQLQQQQYHNQQLLQPMGRITGSASIETLVRVGLEKENGLQPNSKMIVLHDFKPCVDDELEVKRGQIVNVLYQENDWVYVIIDDPLQQQPLEGFIPASYCAQWIDPEQNLQNNFKKKLPRNDLLIQNSTTTATNNLNKVSNNNPLIINNNNNENDYLKNSDSNSKNNNYSPSTTINGMESASQQQHNSIMNLDLISSSNNSNQNNSNTNTNSNQQQQQQQFNLFTSSLLQCNNTNKKLSSNKSNTNSNTTSIPNSNLMMMMMANDHIVSNYSKTQKKTQQQQQQQQSQQQAMDYPAFAKSIVQDYHHQQQPPPPAPLSLHNNTNYQYNHLTNQYQCNNNFFNRKSLQQQQHSQPFFKDQNIRYLILYSFTALDENDINVDKGEIVHVLNKDDPDWFWIRKSDLQEGFIPSSYTCPADLAYRM